MPLKKTLADLAAEARQRGVPELDPPGLADALANNPRLLLIDVREPEERAKGRIDPSIHLPRGVLERDVQKIAFGGSVSDGDLDRPIVCYCGGGHRSLLAADALRQMGFTDVSSLRGGFEAWRKTTVVASP